MDQAMPRGSERWRRLFARLRKKKREQGFPDDILIRSAEGPGLVIPEDERAEAGKAWLAALEHPVK